MVTARSSRQGFLGDRSEETFAAVRVAVLGLGGGGSHIVQHLAHVGFKRFVICDPDRVKDTNLNRLIGATEEDVAIRARKVDVAARMIRSLASHAEIEAHFGRWQEHAPSLRGADVIFGCLDGYAARQELEAFARRYLVPLVDIGLDVYQEPGEAPSMSGQVILSMPGTPCMMCLGFLNDLTLTREAARYGDAGIRPQVVWANGSLASAAVGIAIDLLTGWSGASRAPIYLEYDGNVNTLVPHKRLMHTPETCTHYPIDNAEQLGDPVFRPV